MTKATPCAAWPPQRFVAGMCLPLFILVLGCRSAPSWLTGRPAALVQAGGPPDAPTPKFATASVPSPRQDGPGEPADGALLAAINPAGDDRPNAQPMQLAIKPEPASTPWEVIPPSKATATLTGQTQTAPHGQLSHHTPGSDGSRAQKSHAAPNDVLANARLSSSNLTAANGTPPKEQHAVPAGVSSLQRDRNTDSQTALLPQETLRPQETLSPQETTPPFAPMLQLEIENVRQGRGPVRVAVFTSPENFPDSQAATQTLELSSLTSTLRADLPMNGPSAIAVYQDINGDGALTKNRFGIPIEPCGFSNNAIIKRGPPSFKEAAVDLANGEQPMIVRIRLP